MLDWLAFAVALLKLVNYIINWAHDRGMIDEGRRQVIAEQAANIQAKVAVKEKIREEVNDMSEDEVDAELGALGDPDAGSTKPVHPGTS